MDRIVNSTSAYDKVVRHSADEWHRLDREEAAERRARGNRSAARTRALNRPKNGPVVTEVKVCSAVMKAALKAAGGDSSRLRIVSDTEVWVV